MNKLVPLTSEMVENCFILKLKYVKGGKFEEIWITSIFFLNFTCHKQEPSLLIAVIFRFFEVLWLDVVSSICVLHIEI